MLQQGIQVKNRDSSVELLRIIAMLMIVFHHFAVHGGFQWEQAPISITRLWYNFIIMGGKIGVDVFVMISGYYLINDNRRSLGFTKIAKYVGQVFFYSIVIFIIWALTGDRDIGGMSIIKTFFPLTFGKWWFASAYFVLYLMHPFLNKLLHNLDKALYQTFLLILVVCWSVIPTFTASSFQSNSLLWFVVLYAIAGYIRLYGLNNKFTTKHYVTSFFVLAIFTYLSSVLLTASGNKWILFASYTTYFYGQEKITTLLISLCLFMTFSTLKMDYRKWINTAASATFGVYLIHDNSIVRQFLWIELFKNAQYQNSLLLIPYSIIVVTIVYAACSLIDLLRQHIIEKPAMLILQHCSNKTVKPLEKTVVFLKDFIFGK